MGKYSCLKTTKSEHIWEGSRGTPPGSDIIFTEEDKYTEKCNESEIEEDCPDTKIIYKTTRTIALFRLSLAGYSIKRAKTVYENWRDYKNGRESQFFDNKNLDEKFFTQVTFDEYLQILSLTFEHSFYEREKNFKEMYVCECPTNNPYAFPSDEILFAVMLRIHLLPVDSEIILDLYDLMCGEYWDDSNNISDESSLPKLIIIPEGKSDAKVLSECIQYCNYSASKSIRIFDFDYNPPGGTGNNVNLLKSLMAAGFSDNILFIFDNDSAGVQAYEECRKIDPPNNFIILRYPNLDHAKNYPTIGPTGELEMDINGRACGIELYLGLDCLIDENKHLIKIQWTGYNVKTKSYQGELIDKDRPHQLYNEKVKRIKIGKALALDDISPQQKIVEHIIDSVIQR